MLHSYDLKGNKSGFSELISNTNPEATFLVSNSNKSVANKTKFSWQTDHLDSVLYDLSSSNQVLEENNAASSPMALSYTTELSGTTQIFQKSFSISDTALQNSVYGRKKELEYQLIKAGKEVKIMMEKAFSSRQKQQTASNTLPGLTDGLFAQIAALDVDNPSLPKPAKAGDHAVHKSGKIDFDSLDNICRALYRAGSSANVILTNPVNYIDINKAVKAATITQLEMLDEVSLTPSIKRQTQVNSFTDSLGKVWEIKYSNFAPTDLIYFLNPEDLTQRVLREPQPVELGKTGSAETWMVVIEAGLQLANPYCAGVLEITP